jgi:enterochelin esterase-like enzyme
MKIDHIIDFPSRQRKITVYTPPGYETVDDCYPVFYMHDNQNIWDNPKHPYGGWKVDTTADRLIMNNEIEPVIIVGINNAVKRAEEYVGYGTYYGFENADNKTLRDTNSRLSRKYADMLVNEIKPWIDSEYRTKPGKSDTSIGGSSFGAMASLYIAGSYPDYFSRIAALSGGHALPDDNPGYWKEKPFNAVGYLVDRLYRQYPSFKIYLDCGDQGIDSFFIRRTREMNDHLSSLGYIEGVDIMYREFPGETHDESAWAKRVPLFLKFLYEKNTN